MVAETIDRIKQEYLQGGVAARAVNSKYQPQEEQQQNELNLSKQVSPSKRLDQNNDLGNN